MKSKIVLFFACGIAMASGAHAQIKKGSVLLGGSVGISTDKKDYEDSDYKTKNNIYTISPAVGWAIKDNLIFGADVQYAFREQKENSYETKSQSIGAGVFLRRYWEVLNRFYIFGQGRFGGNYFKEEYPMGLGLFERKGFSLNVGITPGISYAVSKKVHLESAFMNLLSASFTQYKGELKSGAPARDNYKGNTFSFNGNLDNPATLTLGVRVLLAKS